jgi:hypothetical protein
MDQKQVYFHHYFLDLEMCLECFLNLPKPLNDPPPPPPPEPPLNPGLLGETPEPPPPPAEVIVVKPEPEIDEFEPLIPATAVVTAAPPSPLLL